MNGKERITAVLEGRPTDRVPTNLLFFQGYIAHCAGRKQWEFDYGTADDQLEMVLASAGRHPANDGIWTQTGMNRYPIAHMHVEMIDGKPWAIFDDGRRKALDDSPANGPWNLSPDQVKRNLEASRVRSPTQIDETFGPIIPAQELAKDASHTNLARLADRIGDGVFLWVNFSSLFATALCRLGGPEDGWITTATDPELVEAVMERSMQQHLEFVDAAATAGGHGLWACFMNEGANILSPDTWRSLVKPFVAPLVKRTHEHGMKFVAWFLDDCRPLVADLIELGIDGLATEMPRVNYQCTPGDLRRLAGDELCIFSWFREQDLLRCNLDAIRSTLVRQYGQAGSGKPFAISTPGLTQEVDRQTVDIILREAMNL